MYYEHTVRLSGMDVDGRGVCKASALLNHLQNAATLAAEDGGFSREMLIERYGAFWMLARSWFALERPLKWEEPVTIRTWHREDKGAMMYRDYDIFSGGEKVGESVSGWVLASLADRRLVRLSTIAELKGTGGGPLCKEMTLSKLRLPGEMALQERRRMHYSDTDLNGHVNNIRYADFACDAAQLEKLGEGEFLSRMQIGYLAECRPGEVLDIRTGPWEGGVCVQGADGEGRPRFEAALVFRKTLP